MNIIRLIIEKLLLFKNNPKISRYWGYKIINHFKKTPLNNGERYDPNIFAYFGMNDRAQEARYFLARDLINPREEILDIACGTGYGTLLLSEKSSHITGVDVSSDVIEYARENYQKNSKIDFVASDLFNYHQPADSVISFETIEHVNRPVKETVLKLLSLTKKLLIFSVPYQEPVGHNRHHIWFNLDEHTFDFIDPSYEKTIIFQSYEGRISTKPNNKTATLIIAVYKE